MGDNRSEHQLRRCNVKALTQCGPVYNKRQRQICENPAMTLAILFSLKTMKLLENGLEIHSDSIAFPQSSIASVIA